MSLLFAQVFFYTDVKFQASPGVSQNGSQSFRVFTTQLPVMISSVESKLGALCGVVSVDVGVVNDACVDVVNEVCGCG